MQVFFFLIKIGRWANDISFFLIATRDAVTVEVLRKR